MPSKEEPTHDGTSRTRVCRGVQAASRLLAELAAEDDFDRQIDRSVDKRTRLAREALEEHRAALTEELDPDQQ